MSDEKDVTVDDQW